MENADKEYILVLSSHNRAVYLLDKLTRKRVHASLVSTPCKISYGCTQALRFKEKDLKFIIQETEKNNVVPTGLYKIIKVEEQEEYIPI